VVDAVRKCRSRAEGHGIRVELPTLPVIVPMEPNLIHQVLVNMIDNAIRYTPGGDDIIVRSYPKEKEMMFEVEDFGPGIPENEKERIFSRFYTLRKRGGRTDAAVWAWAYQSAEQLSPLTTGVLG